MKIFWINKDSTSFLRKQKKCNKKLPSKIHKRYPNSIILFTNMPLNTEKNDANNAEIIPKNMPDKYFISELKIKKFRNN